MELSFVFGLNFHFGAIWAAIPLLRAGIAGFALNVI
jgi:hypothetical protein